MFRTFIEEKLGPKYVENRTLEFAKSFEETSPSTPIFFILSPGVNPLKDVEQLGFQMGYTLDKGNFYNVSLGQGQGKLHCSTKISKCLVPQKGKLKISRNRS